MHFCWITRCVLDVPKTILMSSENEDEVFSKKFPVEYEAFFFTFAGGGTMHK